MRIISDDISVHAKGFPLRTESRCVACTHCLDVSYVLAELILLEKKSPTTYNRINQYFFF
jgi:hypothetical protein